jgi:hypothetical protein
MSDFKTQYLKGEIAFNKINDFISKWHESSDTKITLQDFLGLTDTEYHASLHGLSNLKKILDSEKHKKSVASFSDVINKHYDDKTK